MITRIDSATIFGVQAHLVTVETDIARGMSNFTIVGLPDTRIQEARERIRSAIKQSGYEYPYNFRITVNLAPSSVPKEGTGFDLPIALTIIHKQIPLTRHNECVAIGELALDGAIRPVPGILARVRAAHAAGKRFVLVPKSAVAEAALYGDIGVYGVSTLKECVEILRGVEKNELLQTSDGSTQLDTTEITPEIDFADITGNQFAKRALEIAAVGFHHVLFNGPPGTGKTMLAKAFIGILPDLSDIASRELTEVYSNANITQTTLPITRPQFRSPHHSITPKTLLGGWRGRTFLPGEITLAHQGVLFMDEFAEFTRQTRELLREPLESGNFSVSHHGLNLSLPAKFILIAAQNPCPCGYANDIARVCTCSPRERLQYRKKISGPIYDRIGIHCSVEQIKLETFSSEEKSEPSKSVRERVATARNFLQKNVPIDMSDAVRSFAISAAEKLHLSSRGLMQIISISRSISALDSSCEIKREHVSEALQYRSMFNEHN